MPLKAAIKRSIGSGISYNMVLLLDYLFVHRLTGIEGKDGNPLTEVRVICNSLLGLAPWTQRYTPVPKQKNIMTAEKSIKLSQEKSVLKIAFGAEIRAHEAESLLIEKAFFAKLERKYLSDENSGPRADTPVIERPALLPMAEHHTGTTLTSAVFATIFCRGGTRCSISAFHGCPSSSSPWSISF
jgi:hypothetical protein